MRLVEVSRNSVLNAVELTLELTLHIVEQFHIPNVTATRLTIELPRLEIDLGVDLIEVDVRWPSSRQNDLLRYNESVRFGQSPCDLIEA